MSDTPTREEAQSALLMAVLDNNLDHAARLLSAGCLPHYVYPSKETPFGMALGLGNLDMAALMIRHGADANHQAERGVSPLPLTGAVAADLAELSTRRVEFLLRHGADPRRTWRGEEGSHDIIWFVSGLAKAVTPVQSVTLADMLHLLRQQAAKIDAEEARRREALKAGNKFKL